MAAKSSPSLNKVANMMIMTKVYKVSRARAHARDYNKRTNPLLDFYNASNIFNFIYFYHNHHF